MNATARRKRDTLPDLISPRVLSVWGLTPGGRVRVGRVQPTPDPVHEMYAVGSEVVIVTPDNRALHNTRATVLAVEPWGCHLDAPAAESGRFRAVWEEMVLV